MVQGASIDHWRATPFIARPWAVAAAIASLMMARLLFVAFVVPPWQNPDEPSHMAVIRALAEQSRVDLTKRRNLAVQAEILASMSAHGWWEAYGAERPDAPAESFFDVPAHLGDSSWAPAFYYVLASRYCRLVGAESLLDQYYAMRAASMALSIATLVVIFAATREWFDAQVAVVAATLVALVPQFAISGISVSPDAFIFLCAATVWWQAARLYAGRAVALPVVVMIVSATAAVLSKQSGAPLLVQTAVLLLVAVARLSRGNLRRALVLLAASSGAIGLAFAATLYFGRPNELALLQAFWAGRLAVPESVFADPRYLAEFTWNLARTTYFTGGWLRYFVPDVMVGIAGGVAGAGAAGAIFALRHATAAQRWGFMVAVIFVSVQIAAIYGTTYLLAGQAVQGRLLFGAIGPAAAICAFGLSTWPSPQRRAFIVITAVALFATLDILSSVIMIANVA